MSEAKYVDDLNEAEKFWIIYRISANAHCHTSRYGLIGADLFYRMTYLELIVANGCGRFFFEEQDLELKARAARSCSSKKNLPQPFATEACKTMQVDLTKFSTEKKAIFTRRSCIRLRHASDPLLCSPPDQGQSSKCCRPR